MVIWIKGFSLDRALDAQGGLLPIGDRVDVTNTDRVQRVCLWDPQSATVEHIVSAFPNLARLGQGAGQASGAC